MDIWAAGAPAPNAYPTLAYPAAEAPGAEQKAQKGLEPGITSDPSRSLKSLEREFGSLTSRLARQFAALVREFNKALRALAGAYRKAASGAEVDPTNAAAARHTEPVARQPYDGIIRRAAQRHEMDPNLVRAVVAQESGFDAKAVSAAGALGLMQLMPETAKSLGVADPLDPTQNVEAGTRLLRDLVDRYPGRLDLALAAYNAGPAAVDKYGTVPPYAETQKYVRDVLAAYRTTSLASS